MDKKMKNEMFLDEEIEKRIEIMEKKDYVFAKKFNRNDYVIVTITVLLCLFIIIVGVYL